MRMVPLSVILGPALLFASAGSGSLEDAEKAIIERFATIRSCVATVTTLETDGSGPSSAKSESTRRIEWVRKGSGFLYRAESASRTTRTHSNESVALEAGATTVSDGVSVVTLADRNGQKTAIKRKADVTHTPDIRALLDALRNDQELRRLPDVKVGLDECFAIQGIPKNRADSDIGQTVIYFRKDIGLDVRTVAYDKKNEPVYTSSTTDIRINVDLPPDRFRVVIPDGVELVDQTKKP